MKYREPCIRIEIQNKRDKMKPTFTTTFKFSENVKKKKIHCCTVTLINTLKWVV